MKARRILPVLVFLLPLVVSLPAAAVVISDDFTQASSKQNWVVIPAGSTTNPSACLTAGNGTGSIPACPTSYKSSSGSTITEIGGVSGSLPDPVGQGALRLTNASNNQKGAIILNPSNAFPMKDGVQVSFVANSYGGNGADGFSFFLMDASVAPNLGAFGGSLGYSCSQNSNNWPWDGMQGAYLGLGIDEYGNFLNISDDTATGSSFQSNRIGLRGAGNISWATLSANYPQYYPSSLTAGTSSSPGQRENAVRKTCQTGQVWDYSKDPNNPTAVSNPSPALLDYAAIPSGSTVVSSGLAQTSATKRGQATPITYRLRINTDTNGHSLLSVWYTYGTGAVEQPVLKGQDITNLVGTAPTNVLFGFAGSTGGLNDVHEITCFKATPADVSSSSAGINVQQTAQINTGTQVYLAFYSPSDWTGQLLSRNLVYDATTQKVSIQSTANWDASCVLTGGTCSATNSTITAQGPTNRALLTWDDAAKSGIPFEWANLNAGQTGALNQGDSLGSLRLSFLRGDRSDEQNSLGAGDFRARGGVLGDIIDSSPTWVGPAAAPYPAVWIDQLYGSATPAENATTAQTYPAFVTAVASRPNVVYSGANDGLLHGFRSGSYQNGVYDTTVVPNDGREVLGYMPGTVLKSIHNASTATLDYSNPSYAHAYFVDGTPGTGDLFYAGKWHTWLMGGLGPGGNAIYALDITDPTKFSEANSSSLVMGEWNSSSLSCSAASTGVTASTCGAYLGQTYGTPVIRRFHNGQWGAVFGNGWNNGKYTAGIYVMTVDSTSGAQSFYYLDTGAGSSGSKNGIAFVTPVDLDGDHVVDYVYAGDLLGNVWRFDLTGDTPAKWTAATPFKLFTTPSGQPIATKVVVAAVPASTGAPRVIVDFGTGGQLAPQTTSAAATYASGSQYLYGVWDWNMGNATTGWNSMNPAAQYASLSSASFTASSLVTQTITNAGNGYRTVSSNTVCWAGTSGCSTSPQYGWQMQLPASVASGSSTLPEQIIYSPIFSLGSFIVNTTVPASNSTTGCTSALATGWTMAINPGTGAAFQNSFFADASGNFTKINGQAVSGIALSATGSPSVVTAGTGSAKRPYLVNQTVSGAGTVNAINPPGGSQGKRLTWIERR